MLCSVSHTGRRGEGGSDGAPESPNTGREERAGDIGLQSAVQEPAREGWKAGKKFERAPTQ